MGIIADNRPEWVVAQMGIMAAGAVPAPMYATLQAEQIGFVLDHADITIAFCDSTEQAAKLTSGAGTRDLKIVALVPFEHEGAMPLDELRALGRSDLAVADARVAAIDPDEMGLLIYTSGTTGEPKGVMLRSPRTQHASPWPPWDAGSFSIRSGTQVTTSLICRYATWPSSR